MHALLGQELGDEAVKIYTRTLLDEGFDVDDVRRTASQMTKSPTIAEKVRYRAPILPADWIIRAEIVRWRLRGVKVDRIYSQREVEDMLKDDRDLKRDDFGASVVDEANRPVGYRLRTQKQGPRPAANPYLRDDWKAALQEEFDAYWQELKANPHVPREASVKPEGQ